MRVDVLAAELAAEAPTDSISFYKKPSMKAAALDL